MRVIFDLRRVGLGNNGGSLTLVRSGNALVELGHKVYFIDSMRNQHTWSPMKAKHTIVKNKDDLPDADIIIATGYKSVARVIAAPSRCGIKSHWIRGWETWQMPEKMIVQKILKAPTIKFVNSIGLKFKLLEYGVESHLVRPGYDLDDLYPTGVRDKPHKTLILGGLYHQKHRVIKRVDWLFNAYRELDKRGFNVRLNLMGAENNPGYKKGSYLRQPTMKQKLEFYNNVDIWLSPAMQEGLHMPPAEAMMTECPVVSTKADLSGTQDYITDMVSGLLADNNFDSFVDHIQMLCDKPKLRKKLGAFGRRRILTIGDRKRNMAKFVKLTRDLINESISNS